MIWPSAALSALDAVPVGADVVYAFIGLGGEPAASDRELLDPDERLRADRFVHESDRTRFILAHAALRLVLARCLGVEPAAIRYERGPQGKPRLAGALQPVEFNMAHSHDLGLVAVTRDRPVGVDVERLRDIADTSSLADSYFSVRERSAIAAAAGWERSPRFLQYWTRKEAVIKASGEGLSRELDTFDVDTAPHTVAIPASEGRPGHTEWWVLDLPAPDGFLAAGAVATAGDVPAWRAL
jgi:4'-phosphopantetheinyl transferase